MDQNYLEEYNAIQRLDKFVEYVNMQVLFSLLFNRFRINQKL